MRKKEFFLYQHFFKRFIDILLSTLALIIFSPFIIVISILIRIKLGAPIIFKQVRPGLNEKEFTLYKFRSMTNAKNSNGELLPDSERLTKFGKFLRKSSLDELPEIINIIKGEMSIVGPRPLSKLYLPYYTEDEHKRHRVKPGLTGLAQINGRNYISWEERFEYDLQYVKNISFCLDLKIIFKTFFKVVKGSDIGVLGVDFKDNSLDDIRKGKS